MYYLLAMLTGFLAAVMLVVNGGLSAAYGIWLGAVIIHAVGLAAVLLVYTLRRGPLLPKPKVPLYYFLGGALGVGTTVFSVAAFGVISVSAITALSLLGQALASLGIDHYGLLGMEKRPFQPKKLVGFALIAGGIVLIMTL